MWSDCEMKELDCVFPGTVVDNFGLIPMMVDPHWQFSLFQFVHSLEDWIALIVELIPIAEDYDC